MSNINVAIADDNEQIRQNLQEIISKEKDMTLVGSASDGLDALSMIRTSHPDVVLLDIIMPKMPIRALPIPAHVAAIPKRQPNCPA